MKRIIAGLLLVCTLATMLSGCSLDEEDLGEILEALTEAAMEWAKNTGKELIGQAKETAAEKYEAAAESTKETLAGWKEDISGGLNVAEFTPERYLAKPTSSDAPKKGETIDEYTRRRYGNSWADLSREQQQAVTEAYFADAIHTGDKKRLDNAVALFLKTETGDNTIETLAKGSVPDSKLTAELDALRYYTSDLSGYFTPQACSLIDASICKYVPAFGNILTIASCTFDVADILTTDPAQMPTEEVLEKLVNLTTSVMNLNPLLLWAYDAPLKASVKLAKEAIENEELHIMGLTVYGSACFDQMKDCFDHKENWGATSSVERIKRGEGPSAKAVLWTLEQISVNPYYQENPDDYGELVAQLNRYLQWRIEYEMEQALTQSGTGEGEKPLAGLCGEILDSTTLFYQVFG